MGTRNDEKGGGYKNRKFNSHSNSPVCDFYEPDTNSLNTETYCFSGHIYSVERFIKSTALFIHFRPFSYTTSVVLSAGSPFVTVSQPMKVRGKNYRAVWMEGRHVVVINQPLLPHRFGLLRLK